MAHTRPRARFTKSELEGSGVSTRAVTMRTSRPASSANLAVTTRIAATCEAVEMNFTTEGVSSSPGTVSRIATSRAARVGSQCTKRATAPVVWCFVVLGRAIQIR